MPQTIMVQRHTIADGFIPVGDDATSAALTKARQAVGDAEWKAGYTKERSDAVRSALKEHGVAFSTALQGKLEDVSVATTQANGAEMTKLRVALAQDNGDRVILTGDMRSEFSQRLLSKLDTVTQQADRGQTMKIGGFAEVVEKNGRSFVNHVATLKGEDGQEIKAAQGHFAAAAEKGIAAAQALEKAGIKAAQVLNQAKDAARVEYFSSLAGQIHDRLNRARDITPIEQAGQITGRFVSAADHGERTHIEMQRAGVTLLADVPKGVVPLDTAPGTPLKLRFDQKHGVTAEIGKPAPDKERGL